MRRISMVAVAGGMMAAAALACGEVPTLADGIAFITPVVLPAPAVAFGDTLRDSLGRATPLRVFAIGRMGDTISGLETSFLIVSPRSGARIGADGTLVAPDSLTTLRVVGQVAGRLQTTELTIEVVRRADAMSTTSVRDTASRVLPRPDTLSVTVTGLGPDSTRGGARGIIVRYRTQVFPASAGTAGRFYLVDDAGRRQRPDSTAATDTTDASGIAARTLIALAPEAGETPADSVVVTATAHSLGSTAILAGGPVRFVLRVRR